MPLRTIIKSFSKTFLVAYQCSNCGAINVFPHTITASATARFNKVNQKAAAEASAQQQAYSSLFSSVQSFTNDVEDQKFLEIGFHHPCCKCGHQEPWDGTRLLNSSAGVKALVLVVILTFLSLAAGFVYHAIWIATGIFALILVAPVFIDKLMLSKRRKKLDACAELHYPVVAEDAERLRAQFREAYGVELDASIPDISPDPTEDGSNQGMSS